MYETPTGTLKMNRTIQSTEESNITQNPCHNILDTNKSTPSVLTKHNHVHIKTADQVAKTVQFLTNTKQAGAKKKGARSIQNSSLR